MTPFVKISQRVASEQPDEAVLWITLLQPAHGIDGVACTLPRLEVAGADSGAARLVLGRSEARVERGHVLRTFLQRIAGRNQPPHFVQAERAHRPQADMPMPAVRRVERAAEEA